MPFAQYGMKVELVRKVEVEANQLNINLEAHVLEVVNACALHADQLVAISNVRYTRLYVFVDMV